MRSHSLDQREPSPISLLPQPFLTVDCFALPPLRRIDGVLGTPPPVLAPMDAPFAITPLLAQPTPPSSTPEARTRSRCYASSTLPDYTSTISTNYIIYFYKIVK